ncbi:MAG: hypothetical protein GY810_02910 [Aureispira sp.]|nr:hypothetical protein [Aureispira sp.]
MSRQYYILLLFFQFFCSTSSTDNIVGVWTMKDKFYQASYQIVQEGNSFSGLVLHYNDGTTQYRYQESSPQFIFKNIIKQEDTYVDAISGATQSTSKNKSISIKLRSLDTIEATRYISKRPIKELWLRKPLIIN